MRLFLISNKIDIIASEEEKFEFVISSATGNKKYEEIVNWLKSHIILK
jgi:death-on-curing protein